MRRHARALAVAAALTGLSACDRGGSGAAAGKHGAGSAEVGGQVVSTVHGYAITVAEVQALVNASSLTPEQALRRLQAERLLMAEADVRGHAADREVDWVRRQAAVQALLDQVARTAAVSDDELRAAYDKAGPRFGHPELRVSVHVLAKLPKQPTPEAEAAAKAFAQTMIGPLAAAEDPAAFARSLKGKKEPLFDVVAEALPPAAENTKFEAPFIQAVYSVKEPGVVPAPVRTSYGWHAVRVTQVIPENRVSLEQAAQQLRPELLTTKRAKLVDELIARAEREHGVQRAAAAASALASLPP